MRKPLFAALLLTCLPAFAQAPVDKDDPARMQNVDPAMQRAYQRARATLDDFLVKARTAPAGQSDHALKIAVTEGEHTEFFWITGFRARGDDQFEGEIATDPRIVKSVKLGQRYTFRRARIVDWTYTDDTRGKMMGNYTLCAMLTKETKAEADAVKARLKIDCD